MFVSLPNAYGDASTNMAIDAALLQTLPEHVAAFRHYGWIEPSVSFGYAQPFQAVAHSAPAGSTLVRRITGGGLVDHRNDWTYAFILNAHLPAVRTPATQLYEQVHRALARALAEQGIPSRFAPCPRACDSASAATGLAVCFTQPAANDVLRPDGRKIAGAALKRNRNGLLLQGSLDRAALPETFDENAFQREFVAALADLLRLRREQPDDLRSLFDGTTIQRERERFASDQWNRKR